MTTARTIIRKAMQKCGILTKHQSPSADEANDGLDALNAMLASWRNDSLMVYARVKESFPLTSGVASYTMGTGGDFDTDRPVEIKAAYCRLGQTDNDVNVITDEAYAAISFKTAQGVPEWVNNDNAYPLATLNFYPTPSSGLTIFLVSEKPLTQFATLDTVVDLPPGWERALIFNLPQEIAGDYNQEVPASVLKVAQESKSLLQKAVLKNHNLDAQPMASNTGNVYTGWNNS